MGEREREKSKDLLLFVCVVANQVLLFFTVETQQDKSKRAHED